MRQGLFVKINESKWEEFEKNSSKTSTLSADEISKIYIHLTEDLAYAAAHYPDSELVRYLNELTLKYHNEIYRNKPESTSRFVSYWKTELPELLNSSYRYLLYSFLIMASGVLIGCISAANDETFVRLILGDDYVNRTLENISSGDPMAIYKSMGESDMFFGITVNNIRVSLIAFVAGALFSVGTGFILFQNGVMLGVFHYLFFKEGFFDETILTIWIHGTLEISAIIIAGAAGLVMGHGILFPGTYSRIYSFSQAAKKGLKIVLSLVPFFIVAGFLESFITRHTEWPLVVKLIIIALSASIVFAYLYIIPNLNSSNGKKNKTLQKT